MKANELRIGNWVNSQFGGIQQVVDVMCDGVNTLKYEGINYEFIEPIPLTEEWLLKFGFEKNAFNKWVHWNLDVLLYEDGECFESDELPMFIFLKHVHTLQNIYFALTGEELTIKNEDR